MSREDRPRRRPSRSIDEEEFDDEPKSRRLASRSRGRDTDDDDDDEDIDERPTRRSASRDRERGEERSERRPVRKSSRRDDDDDEEDSPRSKKAAKTSGSGWGVVAKKAKQTEEERKNNYSEFWLGEGESAIIQFRDNEPYCTEGHSVPKGKNRYQFVPCQLTRQRHCLLCEDKVTESWKAIFAIWDYRGSYNRDKRRFTYDKPVEKVWLLGPTLTDQIKAFVDKKGKELTEVVLEVSRTGAGKKSSYNIALAYDDATEKVMKPKRLTSDLPDMEELFKAPTDDFVIEHFV